MDRTAELHTVTARGALVPLLATLPVRREKALRCGKGPICPKPPLIGWHP